MLIVEAQLQGAQPVFVERQEIAIAAGAVMHYSTATVDGGIENGVGFAAVLGLHVIGHAIEREISIVSEEHFAAFVPLGAMRGSLSISMFSRKPAGQARHIRVRGPPA